MLWNPEIGHLRLHPRSTRTPDRKTHNPANRFPYGPLNNGDQKRRGAAGLLGNGQTAEISVWPRGHSAATPNRAHGIRGGFRFILDTSPLKPFANRTVITHLSPSAFREAVFTPRRQILGVRIILRWPRMTRIGQLTSAQVNIHCASQATETSAQRVKFGRNLKIATICILPKARIIAIIVITHTNQKRTDAAAVTASARCFRLAGRAWPRPETH